MVTKKKKKLTKEEVGLKQAGLPPKGRPFGRKIGEPPQQETGEGVFTSSKTGRPSGISVGGKTFLGISPQQVKEISQDRAAIGGKELGVIGAKTPEEMEQEQREAEGKAFIEDKGILEEELPETVQLDRPKETDPLIRGVESIPVLGGGIGAIAVATADLVSVFLGKDSPFPVETLIQNPETLREEALQIIQQDVIDKGLTASENFGAVIESIPIAGGLIARYAAGLIETPGGNVRTILSEIDSERERASVIAEKAFTGKLGDPFIAVEQIENIEDNIFRMEQRIRLLSLQSAELRVNADELNRIEEKILRSKERVFIAKQAAAGGIVAPSTDSNIYLTLRDLKGGKNAG